jgi:eukaryotic-like serine/threonine-protein kinase
LSARELPRTLGAYEIVRRIAGGGAAEVFLARARSVAGFEKYVALKMVHARLANDPDATRRLIEEARLTSRLRHRNIVQVIDLGEFEGRHFIAMEYVDGIDLGKLIDRLKPLHALPSPKVASFITRELCEGLEHAHRATDADDRPLRIVHRDVSPSNVLLSYDGEVKLADFGLARSTDRPSSTQLGVIKGKYPYLSPEQVRGHAVDARSDLFGAAAVLYELALGQPPFPDAPLPLLLERVSRGLIEDPATVRPGLPESFLALLRRGLHPDPALRYQSARDFGEALSAFIFTEGPPPEQELVRLIELVAETRHHQMSPLAANLPTQLSDEVTRIEPFANIRARFVSGVRAPGPAASVAPPEPPPAALSAFFDDPVPETDAPPEPAPQPAPETPPAPPPPLVAATPAPEPQPALIAARPAYVAPSRYAPLTAPPAMPSRRGPWAALAVLALALVAIAALYLRAQ